MKKIIIIVSVFIFLSNKVLSQKTDTLILKVTSLEELTECYLIKVYDKKDKDTLYLISKKGKVKPKKKFESIVMGSSYSFVITRIKLMANPPDSNFRIVVGKDILWKISDGPGRIPHLSKNTIGSFIRKQTK